jgi:hypothetical protein
MVQSWLFDFNVLYDVILAFTSSGARVRSFVQK